MEREKPIDPKVVEMMNQLARLIDGLTPPDMGFTLLMFDLGAGGQMNYISNSRRADVIRALKEFVGKMEAEHGSAQ